jgi:2-amino-4-hydroxy-6-hydroxymethyldihydropteridine diphosphokinase
VIDATGGTLPARAAAAGPGCASIGIDIEPAPVRAYVGLGANLGDPLVQLRAAVAAISRLPATVLAGASSVYRSAPVGYLEQPDFYNAAVAVDTRLSPQALLDALLAIEHEGGRTRTFRDAPRLIDLDLLLYGDRIVDQPRLSVPHPRLAGRAFVLLPLAELAPAGRVPGLGSLAALAAAPAVSAQAIERLGALVAA